MVIMYHVIKREKNINNFYLWLISFLVAFVCCWIIKIYVVEGYFVDLNLKSFREMYKEKDENISVYEQCDQKNKKSAELLAPLIAVNPDIIGWLSIKNTSVDYPVMQSPGNKPNFYLDHDSNKKYSPNGSIFISGNEKFAENSKNTVIHGHNLRSGKLFGALIKYNNINFYKKAPVIKFNTKFGSSDWKIFAILKTNIRPEQGKVFNYITSKFKSNSKFLNFLHELKIRSIYDIPVKLNASDKILMLSTCSYEMKDFRTVIVARKVRKNEDENVDVAKVKKVENPKMPEGYYKLKKIKPNKFNSFAQDLKNKKIDWLD
ncbi:MAG: class B sortase [Candidatus Improbicoccus devescovinae]|nr:MAG: class B sortase [Candidatus Improbicoccus devescovinae]